MSLRHGILAPSVRRPTAKGAGAGPVRRRLARAGGVGRADQPPVNPSATSTAFDAPPRVRLSITAQIQ